MSAGAAVAILTLLLGPITLARREANNARELRRFLSWIPFSFAVVPKAELCTRTDSAGTAKDYAKEFPQKVFRRIHTQFPTGRDNWFPQHFEAAQLFYFEGKINFFTG